MEISPSQITAATFGTSRKGYDTTEVDEFLSEVAKALESAQQQATSMEARARAAVARLQEVTAAAERASTSSDGADDLRVSADEAEMISRTLLLAQRTADATLADARSEAERITAEARGEAESTLDSTREMSATILADAKADARQASETERQAAASEVETLVARRELLLVDVERLDTFLTEERDRLRAAARQIEALCDRVPAGLGEVPAPPLAAADVLADGGDETQDLDRPDDIIHGDIDDDIAEGVIVDDIDDRSDGVDRDEQAPIDDPLAVRRLEVPGTGSDDDTDGGARDENSLPI
jgi:DivIVA domain-containing protein